ncbi:iron-containing alcohol dehydrogenase [Streptomyces sp. NPDC015125]|uniref:iron-containing alcohol dehydrogenase n=1 Tax=Streptomyces sp. NPDC015125 TaxID=3364938 RepID=UPI0036F63C75
MSLDGTAADGLMVSEGVGAVDDLADVIRRVLGPRRRVPRVAQVVGAGFAGRAWAARVTGALRPLDPTLLVHEGPTTPAGVAALARRLCETGADTVVAVGGGTVMDAAKAAAALARTGPTDVDRVRQACATGTVPPDLDAPFQVIAVPTTAGTGAEATPFATLWDLHTRRKLSLTGPGVRPRAAVLDPGLLVGLGRRDLATGILDALCQGAEAAWSIRSTEDSMRWGASAVLRAAQVLDRVEDGTLDGAARLTLQQAAHHSGRAIALAQTSSCHALSYPLTLRLGLPHGHACGVTLGRLLRYNRAVSPGDCADPRGPDHVHRVLDTLAAPLGGSPDEAAARLERFIAACGLTRYDDLAVDHRAVATDAVSYPRCHDNPRRLDQDSLSRLLGERSETEEMCG